jgi:hypothetical protein
MKIAPLQYVGIRVPDFFIIILSGVRLSPLGTAATIGLLYEPQIIDDGDCGAIVGMKSGKVKRSTQRKPALLQLCPPQIPHDLIRVRTRASAVGSQRLRYGAAELQSYTYYCVMYRTDLFLFITLLLTNINLLYVS